VLVGEQTDRHFARMCEDLRSNILVYYAGASEPARAKSPNAAEKEMADWDKLMEELVQLQAVASSGPESASP
jgi:hypothetical protein